MASKEQIRAWEREGARRVANGDSPCSTTAALFGSGEKQAALERGGAHAAERIHQQQLNDIAQKAARDRK